jgi:hypothetical protein
MAPTVTIPATTSRPIGTTPKLYSAIPTTAAIATDTPGLKSIAEQKPKAITPDTTEVMAIVELSMLAEIIGIARPPEGCARAF